MNYNSNRVTIDISVASPSFSHNLNLKSKLNLLLPKHKIKFCPQKIEFKGKELHSFLKNSHCAIIGKEKIDPLLLNSCPNLKYISKYGVGTDNIDFEACKHFGVTVYTQKGTNSLSVAELTLGLILSCLRQLSLSDRRLRDGIWKKYSGRQLSGSTVGIIGCGHVGSQLARLLKAFRCKLLLHDIKDITQISQTLGGQTSSFHDLIQSSDIISLHVPLDKSTKYMIHYETFLKMKPNCVLINTSRGKVVHEKDLVTALKNKDISGAALDVFENEPLARESELFRFDNLVFSTHIGGNSREATQAMGEHAIEGVKKFVNEYNRLNISSFS